MVERNPLISDQAAKAAADALEQLTAPRVAERVRLEAAQTLIGHAFLFGPPEPGGEWGAHWRDAVPEPQDEPQPAMGPVAADRAPIRGSVNELVDGALRRIAELAHTAASHDPEPEDAYRDLALARTHFEDGLTRFNSAVYRLCGTWKRADSERAMGWVID